MSTYKRIHQHTSALPCRMTHSLLTAKVLMEFHPTLCTATCKQSECSQTSCWAAHLTLGLLSAAHCPPANQCCCCCCCCCGQLKIAKQPHSSEQPSSPQSQLAGGGGVSGVGLAWGWQRGVGSAAVACRERGSGRWGVRAAEGRGCMHA